MDVEAACKHLKETLLGSVKSGILTLVSVASTQLSRVAFEDEFEDLLGLLRQGNALVKDSYGRWVKFCSQKFVAPRFVEETMKSFDDAKELARA